MGLSKHPESYGPADNEPLYYSAPHNPDDVVWAGSDTEQTPQEIQEKRLRYESHARRYLRGHLPVLQSARLRGPLGEGWVNPWRYRGQQDPDWWQPGSEDMLFTRANVMKWASNNGLEYLAPTEALARCKAAAKAEAEFGNANVEDDSADEGHSGNGFGGKYQPDSSEDPLSQADDIMPFQSDPIFPPVSSARSSLAAKQHIKSVKRAADIQWLKGPPMLKRTRRNSPTPPSPSPMRDFQDEQARRQGHEYTSTRTPGIQAYKSPKMNLALAHGAHEQPEGLILDGQLDFDELGDISGWTTFVSAVDSLRGPEKPQSILQGSTGDADDHLARAKSPLNERAFATTLTTGHKREAYMDLPESISLPGRPRSSQSRASNTETLDGDSFITEVAPSSGNVGKFKYRKRRRKENKSVSSISMSEQNAQDHGEIPPKSPAGPVALGLETTMSNDEVPPKISPNVEAAEDKDEHLEVCPDGNLQPTEALPITDTMSIEREVSLARPNFDSDWDMLDDTELRAEPSLRNSEHLQSPSKSDNEKKSSPHTETDHPENGAFKEVVQDLPPTSNQEDDRIPPYTSKETIPSLDQDKEIEHITSPQSTEEIIKSQIWTEMSTSMGDEPTLNGSTEIEEQSILRSSSDNSRMLQNCDVGDQIRRSPSHEMSNENDGANGESDEVQLEALVTSKTDSYTPEKSSGEGDGPQSPWAADDIQQHQPVVLQGEDEHSAVSSSNRDTQSDQCIVLDNSNRQSPERPKTPENDGIIPFRDFMTPTPSPSQSRGRPSLGGLPKTQALVEAATRNPWANNSVPRPKKRVSFGVLDDEELQNVTSFEDVHKSPPPPQNKGGRHSQDDVFNDGTTAVNAFQKHFAAVKGASRRLSRKTNSSFSIASPAVSAMAEAFIEADRETSVEHKLLAFGEESPSRHLQPISQAMANSSADNDGASPSRSPRRLGAELQLDLDQFLGEADGFLEDWSVEAELKKPTEGQSSGDRDRRRRLFGEMF